MQPNETNDGLCVKSAVRHTFWGWWSLRHRRLLLVKVMYNVWRIVRKLVSLIVLGGLEALYNLCESHLLISSISVSLSF